MPRKGRAIETSTCDPSRLQLRVRRHSVPVWAIATRQGGIGRIIGSERPPRTGPKPIRVGRNRDAHFGLPPALGDFPCTPNLKFQIVAAQ